MAQKFPPTPAEMEAKIASLEEMYEPGVDWNVLNVGINTATYQYPMYIMNKRPQKHMHEYGMVQLTNKTDIKF